MFSRRFIVEQERVDNPCYPGSEVQSQRHTHREREREKSSFPPDEKPLCGTYLERKLLFATLLVRPRCAATPNASVPLHIYRNHERGGLGAIVEENSLYLPSAAIVQRSKLSHCKL